MMIRRTVAYLLLMVVAAALCSEGLAQGRGGFFQKRIARQKAVEKQAAQRPIPVRRRVLDAADILLPEQERDLEVRIWKFENATNVHLAVLIGRESSKKKAQELFAALAKRNRISPEERANSVLIIVFVGERAGRIEVGQNLAAALPPPLRKQILQQRIMRRFKAGQFYAGVNAGLMGVMQAVKPDFRPFQTSQEQAAIVTRPLLTEGPTDTIPPSITILQPAQTRGMKLAVKDKTVLVKGTASDADGVYEISVNGVEAALSPNGGFSAQVKLAVGDNTVSVKAIDTRNNIAEQRFTITREALEAAPGVDESQTAKDEAGSGEGKYYALVIGIDKYSGEWPQLSNATHDASGMADELKSDYRFDKVTLLLDNEATRANIIKQLEWLTDNVRKNDNVLIFYSGHGDYKKNLNKGYWVPVDARSQSTVDYISNSDLQTFLGGIPSHHTLLIADACFSGDIFRGMEESVKKDDIQRYYEEVGRRASRQAMSSGGLEPVMDGGRDGHSVFTYYLLKALKDNSSPSLDAGQLYEDIKIPVANNSDQTPVFNAIKNTGDEGGQFVFHRK